MLRQHLIALRSSELTCQLEPAIFYAHIRRIFAFYQVEMGTSRSSSHNAVRCSVLSTIYITISGECLRKLGYGSIQVVL